MDASAFDEQAFFAAIAASGARALLIGRRALIALGLPVLTADYDFWLHPDDIEAFNAAVAPFALRPNRSPGEARAAGRYVLENDEHVDVMVARSVVTTTQATLEFDALWTRRVALDEGPASVSVPSLDDLILTKQLRARPQDAEDIRLLEALRRARSGG